MNHQHIIGVTPRVRKSPFFDSALAAGAKGVTVYNHMLMPTYYESPEADYWQLMTNVTIWDVGCERQVEITGPDAFTLAQLLTPRNLSKCQIGQCKYVPIVDDNGGMLNDSVLLRLGEQHFWLSLADSDILLWAKGLALGYGLNVQVTEPDVSPLAIQGPNAEAVTAALLGDWVKAVRFFHCKETNLDGIPLVVARSGWSKQGGFELYLRDGRYGAELWDRVMAAGAAWQIAPAAPSSFERIESGLCRLDVAEAGRGDRWGTVAAAQGGHRAECAPLHPLGFFRGLHQAAGGVASQLRPAASLPSDGGRDHAPDAGKDRVHLHFPGRLYGVTGQWLDALRLQETAGRLLRLAGYGDGIYHLAEHSRVHGGGSTQPNPDPALPLYRRSTHDLQRSTADRQAGDEGGLRP